MEHWKYNSRTAVHNFALLEARRTRAGNEAVLCYDTSVDTIDRKCYQLLPLSDYGRSRSTIKYVMILE